MNQGVVLRTSLVYGPATQHRSSFVDWMAATLKKGQVLSLFDDEIRTPICVDDVCHAAMDMLTAEHHAGLWHMGGPERLSRAQMGHIICDVFGLDDTLIHHQKLAESTYPAPRPADVSLDSTRLWSHLSRTPRSFANGLRAMTD